MSIILDHVTKSYTAQRSVISDFSLQIEAGELFVLLGASGSGKSTLLRLIAGLIPLDSGRIWLHGRDVTALSPQQRNTGFVFQNYSLFRHMTAAQNIAFGLSVKRIPRAEQERRVTELLSLIQMEGLGGRMPGQLSGGQQQRVALARALAHQPEVLLLDEPFGALDAKIRVQLRQNLRDIQRRLNVTTILVTHDQDEAFELADRIGVIEKGELLEVGLPSDLYRRPRHRFTATFLGIANLLPARRNSHHIFLADNVALPAPPNTDHLTDQLVEVMFRPEEIALAPSAEAVSGSIIGQAVVQEATFAGPLERVQLRMKRNHASNEAATLQALLNPTEARLLGISPGREVWVGLKNYHLLPGGL